MIAQKNIGLGCRYSTNVHTSCRSCFKNGTSDSSRVHEADGCPCPGAWLGMFHILQHYKNTEDTFRMQLIWVFKCFFAVVIEVPAFKNSSCT
jgi:hypothetical protein